MNKCPHCGGILSQDYDGYEQYLVCVMCAREYDTEGESLRMTPKELTERKGIKLIMGRSLQ